MTSITFKELTNYLESQYPPRLAESWDQVGIHFGRDNATVKRVLVTLDVRESVVDEAIQQNVDTIIAHHPLLFHPIQRMNDTQENIDIYRKLIKYDINVFAMHTNFDAAWNGMNDWLAEAMNLTNIRPLEEVDGEPTIGRIGELPEALERQELYKLVKTIFNCDKLTIIDNVKKDKLKSIAVIGGAGGSLIKQVVAANADVLVTGDITYHTGHAIEDAGLLAIDAGHYIESIFIPKMTQLLKEVAAIHQWDIEVEASQVCTSPFTYY